jgi:hypothetical protein
LPPRALIANPAGIRVWHRSAKRECVVSHPRPGRKDICDGADAAAMRQWVLLDLPIVGSSKVVNIVARFALRSSSPLRLDRP